MMKKVFLFVLIFSGCLFLHSCTECHPEKVETGGLHLEMAVLYTQQSAEYKALCYQTFNLAKLMLDKDLEDKSVTKPRALVFDIDETVLDNSPYEAKCALEGISYPEKWNDWCNLAQAKAIPGALDFINDAHKKGVAIFYISNRKVELFEGTKKNLLQEGFPLTDDSFLLMRTDSNSKESRRQTVLAAYHIAMLFGDNLADFSMAFDGTDAKGRMAVTDSLRYEFGNRFIVLPNTMYGDWEMALYNNKGDMPKEEKAQKRKEHLISF